MVYRYWSIFKGCVFYWGSDFIQALSLKKWIGSWYIELFGLYCVVLECIYNIIDTRKLSFQISINYVLSSFGAPCFTDNPPLVY